jgi:AraC-like DNA-binding protein
MLGQQVHRVGGYREYANAGDMSDCVEAVWMHVPPAGAASVPTIHRVIPDPAVSLCFEATRSPGGQVMQGRLLLNGPVRRVRLYRPAAGLHLESVRLKLEWCPAILGAAARDHVDGLDDYAEVRPDLAAALLGPLMVTRSSAEALERLLAFVRERRAAASAAATASPLVRRGLDVLRRQGGLIRLEAMPAELGVSNRHLRRVVADAAGISPGRFARLLRFHRVLRETDQATKPSWAAIAARVGYADQPHLIRDIRSLSGLSPVQLHRERRAEPA